MKLLTPGVSLAQRWPLWPSGEGTRCERSLFLSKINMFKKKLACYLDLVNFEPILWLPGQGHTK